MTTSPSSSGRGAGPTDPSDILADVRGSDRVAQARHQFEITADGIIKLVKQVLPEESVRDEFWIMLRSMIDGCFQIGQSAGEASEGIMQMQEHLDGVKSQMELHARQTELHAKSVEVMERQLVAFERFAAAAEAIEKKLASKIMVVTDEREE